MTDHRVAILDAFKQADQVLMQGVRHHRPDHHPGLINLDFADVKSVMSNAGSALMGIGSARGEDRARQAAEQAISSPLLEASIDGARGVLLSIAGGSDSWPVRGQRGCQPDRGGGTRRGQHHLRHGHRRCAGRRGARHRHRGRLRQRPAADPARRASGGEPSGSPVVAADENAQPDQRRFNQTPVVEDGADEPTRNQVLLLDDEEVDDDELDARLHEVMFAQLVDPAANGGSRHSLHRPPRWCVGWRPGVPQSGPQRPGRRAEPDREHDAFAAPPGWAGSPLSTKGMAWQSTMPGADGRDWSGEALGSAIGCPVQPASRWPTRWSPASPGPAPISGWPTACRCCSRTPMPQDRRGPRRSGRPVDGVLPATVAAMKIRGPPNPCPAWAAHLRPVPARCRTRWPSRPPPRCRRPEPPPVGAARPSTKPRAPVPTDRPSGSRRPACRPAPSPIRTSSPTGPMARRPAARSVWSGCPQSRSDRTRVVRSAGKPRLGRVVSTVTLGRRVASTEVQDAAGDPEGGRMARPDQRRPG